MKYCLETNSLCKRYRHFQALHDLTMHVPKGAIYGFVGKNGAGKTTLLRQNCGLQEPDSGSRKQSIFLLACASVWGLPLPFAVIYCIEYWQNLK